MFNDANIFLTFLDMLSICMSQDSVSSIITPKYLTKLVCRIRLLSTLIAIKEPHFSILCEDPNNINSVFITFRLSLLALRELLDLPQMRQES